MTTGLRYPIDSALILRRRKALRREILARGAPLMKRRLAILGGSTTSEIRHVLELFLLDAGIEAEIYESEYAKYYEDAVFSTPELDEHRPEVVYVHTTVRNIRQFPEVGDDAGAVDALVSAEVARFDKMWRSLTDRFACTIIQNNFEWPPHRPRGNLEATDASGRIQFLAKLNQAMAARAQELPFLQIHDLNYLASWYGLRHWHDARAWHAYKYALGHDAIPYLARSVASVVRAVCGLSKKGLVLDLDNTLWAGVIGDDGLGGIQLGPGSAEGEAHAELQEYVRELGRRGVALTVCSKNEVEAAREGFAHPGSVLSLEDFAVFDANWDPKSERVHRIAVELNVGVDSLVFFDDNPAERELVRTQCAAVEVPEIGADPSGYLEILDQSGLFESAGIATEDLKRTEMFRANTHRSQLELTAESYDDFLASLEMEAEIGPFTAGTIERVTQLINKTNQFNLTTRRYTLAHVQSFAAEPEFVTLSGRLRDKFGDNGLITVVIGAQRDAELDIDTWLMSCRVLKRGMEEAMLDALAEECLKRGIRRIFGTYLRSKKNKMVADFYERMGFSLVDRVEDRSSWHLDLPGTWEPKNRFIRVI